MDTLLVTPADLHCGSTAGLVPPAWQLKQGGTHEQSKAQMIRWRLWTEAWETIGKQRKGKRLIVVLMGDLVDGVHHETKELVTNEEEEQERMAVECIEHGLKLAKFGKGDLLFALEGTESHANGSEERIARDLNAQPAVKPNGFGNDGRFVHYELHLNINGQLIWMAHHALKVGGKAWTQENPLVSDLRDIYFRQLEARDAMPALVIGAHYHRPTTGTLERNGHTIRGVILPPMQNRTRFARRVAPNQYTRLGLCWHLIDKTGRIERFEHILPEYHKREIEVITL